MNITIEQPREIECVVTAVDVLTNDITLEVPVYDGFIFRPIYHLNQKSMNKIICCKVTDVSPAMAHLRPTVDDKQIISLMPLALRITDTSWSDAISKLWLDSYYKQAPGLFSKPFCVHASPVIDCIGPGRCPYRFKLQFYHSPGLVKIWYSGCKETALVTTLGNRELSILFNNEEDHVLHIEGAGGGKSMFVLTTPELLNAFRAYAVSSISFARYYMRGSPSDVRE